MLLLINLIKERKGADIIIDKIDGGKVEEELIAAKENAILLKLLYSSFDISIDIDEVKNITIIKNQKPRLELFLDF